MSFQFQLSLSWDTIQTILIFSAPFLLPQISRIWSRAQSFLNPRPRPLVQEGDPQVVPQVVPSPPREPRDNLRLVLFTISILSSCFALYYRPINIFTRYSIPITLPSPALESHLKSSPHFQAHSSIDLLPHLRSLDRRIIYTTYGPQALSDCTWCKISSDEGSTFAWAGNGADYLLWTLPGLALQYAQRLFWIGLLTTTFVRPMNRVVGIGQNGLVVAGKGRERWRGWLSIAAGAGFVYEIMTMIQGPGQLLGNANITPVHVNLHIYRHVFFMALSAAAYYLPPAPPTFTPSSASVVAPYLAELAKEQSELFDKLRAVGLERATLMRDPETREKIVSYWERAEQEATWAKQDPDIQSLRQRLQLNSSKEIKREGGEAANGSALGAQKTEEGKDRTAMREWIDKVWAGVLPDERPARSGHPAGTPIVVG